MQESTARAINRARVFFVQRQHVSGFALWIFEIQMRESFPSAAQANHLMAIVHTAIHDILNDGIQSRYISAAGQDTDAFTRHSILLIF
jgi:hypothetical protein